jgi:hypothetical protein
VSSHENYHAYSQQTFESIQQRRSRSILIKSAVQSACCVLPKGFLLLSEIDLSGH